MQRAFLQPRELLRTNSRWVCQLVRVRKAMFARAEAGGDSNFISMAEEAWAATQKEVEKEGHRVSSSPRGLLRREVWLRAVAAVVALRRVAGHVCTVCVKAQIAGAAKVSVVPVLFTDTGGKRNFGMHV